MYWLNFLHIYQPSNQSEEILEKVANECYRPLFRGLLKVNARLNLNINGSLTEIFAEKGYQDILEDIKKLAKDRKIFFTESAKYHAFLPLIPKKFIKLQIKENNKTNKRYFGSLYKPNSFFPPEMAYSPKVAKAVSEMGYKYIILDEISFPGKLEKKIYTVKNAGGLKAVFRERRISNAIMSGIIRSGADFKNIIKEEEKFITTAMDGETLGHHRPGLGEKFLEIIDKTKLKQVSFSEMERFAAKKEVSPLPATWASSWEEIKKGTQFYSWKNPENKVHKLQWKFLNYLFSKAPDEPSPCLKKLLEKAMASDQFFWGSGEPWWSVEMIEKGAWEILTTLKKTELTKTEKEKAEKMYRDILAMAFKWQREGKIEDKAKKYKEKVRIPFRDRTKGKKEVYSAFLEMMRKKEKEASNNRNFEKAILWRDAIWKLETKNDIYDAIHIVNLLRLEVPDKKLKKMMDKYKEQYQKVKPGQPEHRNI